MFPTGMRMLASTSQFVVGAEIRLPDVKPTTHFSVMSEVMVPMVILQIL